MPSSLDQVRYALIINPTRDYITRLFRGNDSHCLHLAVHFAAPIPLLILQIKFKQRPVAMLQNPTQISHSPGQHFEESHVDVFLQFATLYLKRQWISFFDKAYCDEFLKPYRLAQYCR